MPDHSSEISPEGIQPRIYLDDTDGQLPRYFSNGFKRYTDFQPLAKGGAAILQTCKDHNLGRTVVMKTLHPHLASHDYQRARFLREARVTAQLQHPNTVPVYELGHDNGGNPYFTMKKISGETLRDILESQIAGNREALETYNLDRQLGLLIQVCNALAYAHDHGVVHRDVKPENIQIGKFGEVMLLDWGVAKVWAMPEDHAQITMEHEELTAVGQRPGTPLYMSPEQVRGNGQIDERTDVYSIGCVLYEILTLKEPLRGKKINETFDMIINQRPIAPATRAPLRLIPETLGKICLRALEKDPDQRFPTMLSLITALRDFRSQAIQSANS
ncbi:MAG: serine/threonine-protein kinase [Pirellulales bacterium]